MRLLAKRQKKIKSERATGTMCRWYTDDNFHPSLLVKIYPTPKDASVFGKHYRGHPAVSFRVLNRKARMWSQCERSVRLNIDKEVEREYNTI